MKTYIRITTDQEFPSNLVDELEDNDIVVEYDSEDTIDLAVDNEDELDGLYNVVSCIIYTGLKQFTFEALNPTYDV